MIFLLLEISLLSRKSRFVATILLNIVIVTIIGCKINR